ncbi:MAG TPA: ATP-binding cassette domain-containing protein [Dehalococcoidia bacterium]|nr:ATP-binding cassette domain-containing protein [Dehalococcoidia bacterium]
MLKLPFRRPSRPHTHADAAPSTEGIGLEARDLCTEIGRGQVILHDVSLIAEPGELVAIVGISGAGKTTLLGALSGVRPASRGTVTVNGLPLYENFRLLRTHVGYVPQDDIIHTRLSVERALRYAAELRLPAGTKRKQRKRRVAELIEELGLQEQRKKMIHDLSGGQRKRVNIAVELLTRPPLLFLDEPTAGLDPATESRLMDLLRGLANQDRTILIVTHATRNIAICDRVLFLAGGGRMAFFGSPDAALSYFNAADFEEVYVKLSDERTSEEWEQTFLDSPQYRAQITDQLGPPATGPGETPAAVPRALPAKAALKPIGPLRQFSVLSRRYANTIVNDPKYLLVLVLQAPIIALLLWALFQPDIYKPQSDVVVIAVKGGNAQVASRDLRSGEIVNVPPGAQLVALSGPGCTSVSSPTTLPADCQLAGGNGNNRALKGAQLAFILAAVAVWLGTLNAIREIAKEHAIYRRERLVNLRIGPYVGSKFFVLSLLMAVQSLLLLGVAAAHIDFPGHVDHWLVTLPHAVGSVRAVNLPYPAGPIDGVFLSLLLGGIASVAVALAVSAAVSNADRAIVAAPLLMVPQILFAGGLTPVQDLGPAQPLAALVATRWTHEAIGRVTHVLSVAAVPETFPYADALDGDAAGRWLILACFVVVGLLAAMVLQRLKDRR